MSMHSYHDDLPGFDKRQILHDGCPECEHRGENPRKALAHMDNPTFRRALARAIDWQSSTGAGGAALRISGAEARVLEILWIVALSMARVGVADFEGVHP